MYDLTPADCQKLRDESRRRSAAIIPDTPMNRYSISACAVFEEIMDRLARDEGTFETLMAEMFRRQKELAVSYAVDP